MAPGGTVVAIVVAVEAVGKAGARLKRSRLFKGLVSKFVPLIVTAVPAAATVGVKPVIVGMPPDVTVKLEELVAEPAGEVILIGPVAAPTGTVTTSWLFEAEATVAETRLKLTVF